MRILTLLIILFTAIFLAYPEIDLQVSQHFYNKEQGFFLKDHAVIRFIYDLIPLLVMTLVGSMALFAIAIKLRPRVAFLCNSKTYPTYRHMLFILSVLVLVPGVLVHYGAKPVFERPRPREITEFGGVKTYTAPFAISNQDGKSFISGHAATGFFFTCLALLFKSTRNRITAYIIGVSFGCIVGFGRIAQGGHFLSDVLFAGLVTLFVMHLMYWLLFVKYPPKAG
jgi:lipid A 4'-phosphatase